VALNPTDAKALASGRGAPNGLSGCDFAGTVLAVGPKVTKSFQVGERVFGVTFGANPANAEDGAFAEVVTAKGDTVMRIPDGLEFEE
jgi:NADPH:quinone reductase-like Zn-dependent oxidoreductase